MRVCWLKAEVKSDERWVKAPCMINGPVRRAATDTRESLRLLRDVHL